jgi:peptidyl-prolyl cis-trans isomerase C
MRSLAVSQSFEMFFGVLMKSLRQDTLHLFFVVLLGTPTWAHSKAPVAELKTSVATVNHQSVSQDSFVFMLNDQLARGAADSQALRQSVRTELIVQTVVSQQALALKLDQSSEARALLEAVKRNALFQLWQQDWLKKNPIAKETLEEEYKNVVNRLGPDEYQLRHVLLKDEIAARLVLEKAKAGTPLDVLAREYSSDDPSKLKGGLLDWSSPALMVQGLGDVLMGQGVSRLLDAPVQSAVGWHVVRIEGKRATATPSFEALQPQLIRVVTQKALTQAIQGLVNQAKIN